ncbi:MAG: winged helix-turn-helix domain-containing protein [Clostridiaceae bacterium]|nr:winged helix-turn-helix domain-containing protein [Clostridiaceae bacterium]
MPDIHFIRDPGYMFDLFFLFVLQFNKEYCLTEGINPNKSTEDKEFYEQILNNYGPPEEELYPFFYVKNYSKSFITTYYHQAYRAEFTTSYRFKTVELALADYEQVIKNLIRFYFDDIPESELAETAHSAQMIGRRIKESSYSDRLKSGLYSFFLEPIPILQKLTHELTAKALQLSRYYDEKAYLLSRLQTQMDTAKLLVRLKHIRNYLIDVENFEKLYISICLLNKNCVKIVFNDPDPVLFLGSDYDNCLNFLIGQEQAMKLDVFGNALSEENRIEILNLILQMGEITIKDIERNLKISSTNAYYHITLMLKAGMIRTGNQGRTVLYSINQSYFDDVCEALKKYGTHSEKE